MTAPELAKADGQTCARCGADRAEARKYRIRCESWGRRYGWHIWTWSMDE